jgi:hypothetical protein
MSEEDIGRIPYLFFCGLGKPEIVLDWREEVSPDRRQSDRRGPQMGPDAAGDGSPRTSSYRSVRQRDREFSRCEPIDGEQARREYPEEDEGHQPDRGGQPELAGLSTQSQHLRCFLSGNGTVAMALAQSPWGAVSDHTCSARSSFRLAAETSRLVACAPQSVGRTPERKHRANGARSTYVNRRSRGPFGGRCRR